MEENLGNLDPHRADLSARPTKSGGERERIVNPGTQKLGCENGPDGTREGGTVRVPTHPGVNGADVQAGAASNAVKGLASNRILENTGSPVVQKDQVKLLRPVSRMDPGPEGGIGVHPLARGGPGKELEEHLEVLEGGEDLFDAHEGDENSGEGQAHPAIPFRFHDSHRPRFRHGEVGSTDGHIRRQKLRSQVKASGLGQGLRVIGQIRSLEMHPEKIPNLSPVFVDGGNEEMG
jgi:hypothetical protein